MSSTRSAQQQEEISEALWRVLGSGGLQKLTLRAVAAEAGCTTGLVMSRFPTKRALLLHARQMLHERTARRMTDTVSSMSDPIEALTAVLADSSLRPEFNARIWVGFIAATASDPELQSFHVDANHHYLETVGGLVARIQPSWPPERVRDSSARLVALAVGFAVLAAADPSTYGSEMQLDAFAAAAADIAAE
jgi:AcrR family transcriptional regulator